MNRKFFFDLDTVNSELFVGELRLVGFECDVAYSIDLSIVPFNTGFKNSRSRKSSYRNYNSDELFLLKTIPFVLFSKDDLEKKLKSLFGDIIVSVSYGDLGYYSVDGEYYSKAFCVEVNRGGFFI
jgi:hypothetical protein